MVCVCVCGGGGGGGTLIFSYMRRLGSFFGVQNFRFNIFGGFRKNEYFWGYEAFKDIFWGHHKIGLYLGVLSMHYRVFSYGQGTEWGVFLGVAKFTNIFGGA